MTDATQHDVRSLSRLQIDHAFTGKPDALCACGWNDVGAIHGYHEDYRRHVARALLASDWLAQRDAAVAAQAQAQVADLTAQRDRLQGGGAELGKSLFFWMELARKVTNSDDVIEDDGDGDWGVVAERLAELGDRADRQEASDG